MNIDSFAIVVVVVAVTSGIALGAILVWLMMRGGVSAAREQGRLELAVDLATANERASRIPVLEEKIRTLESEIELARQHAVDLREQANSQIGALNTELAQVKTLFDAEASKARENLAILTEAKEALSNQFKSLANDILEEKSKRFTEQNQTNIGQLLNPLKDRIAEFKTKVEEIHTHDTAQQATLKAELAQLKDLNQKMTAEAHDLATALKGQAKKQGNWGELILGNVLDRSGLRDGIDFKREVSFNTADGRKRPDVIIYLPQNKHLVVDAKVSLNAYTRYVNAEL